jgi:ParB-like chromosome segregation protein Spo0J
MSISPIFVRQLEAVKIADLKFDKDNPNIMTEDQMNGLQESMQKYGYLAPIIIDQHNKIIDGEHRLKIFKEVNKNHKVILAIRVEVYSDVDRRLIRQAMNKLKGQHDPEKDIRELGIIMSKDNHRETLKKILQIDHNTVNKMKEVLEKQRTNERSMLPDRDQRLTFYLDNNDHELVIRTLDKISLNKNDALVGLCNDWNEFQKKKKTMRKN